MKKIIILCVYAAFIFSACEKDSDEQTPDFLTVALTEIGENQSMLDKVYEETAKRVTSDTIIYAKNNASSLEEFIQIMSRITDGLFEGTIKSQDAEAFDYYIKIPDIDGESKLEELLPVFELEDPFNGYADLITKKVKSANETENLVLLEAYQATDGNVHRLDQALTSVSYDQVMTMIKLGDILISSAMSDEEQEEAIDELVIQSGIPEVMLGLLLPAIQKYTEEPGNDPFLSWLDVEVGPVKKGGLDRDLIRRVAYAGYLGGLELLADDNFVNDNQDIASVQLMQARYEMTLIFLWAELWEQ